MTDITSLGHCKSSLPGAWIFSTVIRKTFWMESKAFGFLPEAMQYWENYFSNYVTHMHYLPGFLHPIKRKACFIPNFCVKRSGLLPPLMWEEGAYQRFFTNTIWALSWVPSLFQGSLRFFHVFWSQKRWSQTGKCFPSLDGLAIVIWTPLKLGTWSSYRCHCLTFPVEFCSLSFYISFDFAEHSDRHQ